TASTSSTRTSPRRARVRTSPARRRWLGLTTRTRFTRTLPPPTSCAARVRDFTTRANQSHLSSRWTGALGLSVMHYRISANGAPPWTDLAVGGRARRYPIADALSSTAEVDSSAPTSISKLICREDSFLALLLQGGLERAQGRE